MEKVQAAKLEGELIWGGPEGSANLVINQRKKKKQKKEQETVPDAMRQRSEDFVHTPALLRLFKP